MIINANIDKDIAPFLAVLDLDTGNFIKGVEQVEIDTKTYWTYVLNKGIQQTSNNEGYIIQKHIGNIVLVYTGE